MLHTEDVSIKAMPVIIGGYDRINDLSGRREIGDVFLDSVLSPTTIHIHHLHLFIEREPEQFVLQRNRNADAKGILR